jgi:hypothetical protein
MSSNRTVKSKSKVKAKAIPKVKAKLTKATTEGGYLNHRPGRRKGTIHELFDREGPDIAWTRGLKMGLKETTLRSWFAHWTRLQEKTAVPQKQRASAAAIAN